MPTRVTNRDRAAVVVAVAKQQRPRGLRTTTRIFEIVISIESIFLKAFKKINGKKAEESVGYLEKTNNIVRYMI